MMMNGVTRLLWSCLATAALTGAAFTTGALADSAYPTKPVSLIIGFAPGGGNDVMGRLVAEHLRSELGQSVVVLNKAGADGAIAAETVAHSAPDGYMLLSGSSGMMAYNPGLNPSLRYDPMRDFTPVTMIGYSQLVFSVSPSLPVNTLQQLIAYSKANPGKLVYASPSSPHRVAFEAFKAQTGADIRHVPYKGSGPAILAAMSGEVQVLVSSVSDALQQTRAGKLRPLAVTGTERSGFMPDVPTAIESGIRFDSASWIGLYGPKGTPPAVVDRLYKALANVIASDSFKKAIVAVGYEQFPPMTPTQFGSYQKDELERWTKVIKELNLQAQ